MSAPRGTVRLQLHRGFNFDDAAQTVGYHARLGISHFYLSPIFAARTGSTHGYDVVDPTRINPELGGEEGFVRLVAALRASGMGLVIDIVPNHMGAAPTANPYWRDVLQWGRQSPFADWFDIDWNTATPHLRGKILLPVLGDGYDAALRNGELQLLFDDASGQFEAAYHDNRFPLAPSSLAKLLEMQPPLQVTGELFAAATPATFPDAMRALGKAAVTRDGRQAIDAMLAQHQPNQPEGQRRLHALLGQQHYHLSWWRNAAEEINWRRFFEVSDLAGVRVELDPVFEHTHSLIFDLYRRGLVDGLRIDHVDGLADPAAYCRRLRSRLQAMQVERPAPLDRDPAWIVIEKILIPDEDLPSDWDLDGTTGYDFMDQAGAALHDGPGEVRLQALWRELTGDSRSFDQHVQSAREQLLSENFVGECDALIRALHHYATEAQTLRLDIALAATGRVTRALLGAWRPYRSYSAVSHARTEDRERLREAMVRAQDALHAPDHALLSQIGNWLGMTDFPDESPEARALRERAVTRFQQLTPPLAAKSVEDTAFYRYAPILSRNDVGSYPDRPARGIPAFHVANQRRAESFPNALLATATHDHKRGEDVRARLAVLTEMPDEWGDTLRRWCTDHRPLKRELTRSGRTLAAPVPADEIMLYQTLLGAWPSDLQPQDHAGVTQFAARVAAWQQKSLREAKSISSWMLPDADYEQACNDFLQALTSGAASSLFLGELAQWVQKLAPAAEANSLSQTLWRLTSPGLPDLYQGCEFEDLSLVDPDNRRPVDFEARRAGLDRPSSAHRKQQLIRSALACRAHHPALFASGAYLPLEASGAGNEHVVAFARRHGEQTAISLSLRLLHKALQSGTGSLIDTKIQLPKGFPSVWRDAISGEEVDSASDLLHLAGRLHSWPVALLLPR